MRSDEQPITGGNMKKKIIGITGTFGAGKGTVADYLHKEEKFAHFSARTYLSLVLEERGQPINLNTLHDVANELRGQYGPSHIAEKLIEMARETEGNAVIESLRAVAEAQKLLEAGGVLLAVDADQRIRYERIVARRSETDFITFEEFQRQERRQMQSTDPTKQNISAVMNMAHVRIFNNGTLEELERQIEQALCTL